MHGTTQLGHGTGRCGNRLNFRRHDFAIGQPVPAHTHPVARSQSSQVAQLQGSGLLTQYQQFAGVLADSSHRAHQGMNHRNAARLGLRAGAGSRQRNHLTDRQLACGCRPAVVPHGGCRVVLNFEAIDADAGKAGDHTNDACATDAAVAKHRFACQDARAADTTGVQARLGCTGATNAAGCADVGVGQRGLVLAKVLVLRRHGHRRRDRHASAQKQGYQRGKGRPTHAFQSDIKWVCHCRLP